MKYLITLFFVSAVLSIRAQTPAIPVSGNTPESFIPEGWTLVANTSEDFNKDKLIDAAIVIQSGESKTIADYSCQGAYYPQALFIVLKQKDGSYKLSLMTQKLFGSYDCFTFQEIGKRSGTLKIVFMDGSINGTSSEHDYFFRLQQNDWYLIGYRNELAKNAGLDMGIWGTDMNLVTGVTEDYRLKIDPDSDIMDGPKEITRKTKTKPKPLLRLADLDIDHSPFSEW